jgi:hypothetical protein
MTKMNSPTRLLLLVLFGLYFSPSISHAYPAQTKIWVLPFHVEGSTTATSERPIQIASYVEAALSTTYEGGQPLMSPQEVALAMNLTGVQSPQAYADDAWVSRIAKAANVNLIVEGTITVSGSSATVNVVFRSLAIARSQKSTVSGDVSHLVPLCIKALRTPLFFTVDNTWPWTEEIPLIKDSLAQAAMIRAIGNIGGGRYAKAIEELVPLTTHEPPISDAEYWLIQSYASAGMPKMASREAESFLKRFPQDPRATEIKKLLKMLPKVRDHKPATDKS